MLYPALSTIGRTVLVVWMVLHMFFVAVYSLPSDSDVELFSNMRTVFVPIARPYLFATSQWQRWNLFAPNPKRRVSEYHVQKKTGEQWEDLLVMTPWNEPLLRRTQWVKLGNALDRVGGRLLHLTCNTYDLNPLESVSILERWYVIPETYTAEWVPTWNETRTHETLCIEAA